MKLWLEMPMNHGTQPPTLVGAVGCREWWPRQLRSSLRRSKVGSPHYLQHTAMELCFPPRPDRLLQMMYKLSTMLLGSPIGPESLALTSLVVSGINRGLGRTSRPHANSRALIMEEQGKKIAPQRGTSISHIQSGNATRDFRPQSLLPPISVDVMQAWLSDATPREATRSQSQPDEELELVTA